MSRSRVNPSGNAVCRTRELYPRSDDNRFSDWHLDHMEWCAITVTAGEQRHGHVVDRHVSFGPPFQRAAVCVAVKHRAAAIAVDRLFQARRSQKRINLLRLSNHGGVN